jgi:hypothetical protein
MNCKICGKEDMFTYVSGKPACAICVVKYIGGGPITNERVQRVRYMLGLKDDEYLKQDNAKEAAKILGLS